VLILTDFFIIKRTTMVTIKLEKLNFHAFHGIYSGEPLVGSAFEVNLEVEYDDNGISYESINDTISYVSLLEIVRLRMKVPTPLLEKIAKDVLDKIVIDYPFIKRCAISIYKLQPPVISFEGRLGISMSRVY
jgi:dihydroneopterin aldolase